MSASAANIIPFARQSGSANRVGALLLQKGFANERALSDGGRLDNYLESASPPSVHNLLSKQAQDAAMTDITREEIRAQHEAIEARVETKVTRLEGKLDLLLSSVQTGRDETRESRRAVIANIWVFFGAVVVVIGIFITVAPVIFDMGSRWRETISKEVNDRVPGANHN